MKIGIGVGIYVMMLAITGCSAGDEAGNESAYKRIVPACSLISSDAIRLAIGQAAQSKESANPEVQAGDEQSTCSWSHASSGGGTILLAERIHAKQNGGSSAAQKSFDQERESSCKDGKNCRDIANLGDDSYLPPSSAKVHVISPGASIDLRIRDRNVVIVVSCIRGVGEVAQSGAGGLANSDDCISVGKEIVVNLRALAD